MDLSTRSSGILLPLFSLPGTKDAGALGRGARNFADFLARAGQSWWQMLPINPIDQSFSPYASVSAFAGEPLYLDLEDLAKQELLDLDDLKDFFCSEESHRVDYPSARSFRRQMLRKAFERFTNQTGGEKYRRHQERFIQKNSDWLADFVLYSALSEKFQTPVWSKWPKEFRRHEDLVRSDGSYSDRVISDPDLRRAIDYALFEQLVFDVQWREFKQYCNDRKIFLLGDVPIYVGKAGSDTWAHRELFQIDPDGQLLRVAGVPGDSFNPTGQRWNMPLYDWKRHEENGFKWWLARMTKTLERFDAVRLDHFIGFYNYYSFPADENLPPDETQITDEKGRTYEKGWVPGPQEKLFDVLFANLPKESFLAEDLGVMNAGVHQLRNHYDLPGMAVLQFSFDNIDIKNPIKRWPKNFVVCTGTHDTAPVLAWLTSLEKGGPKNPYGPNFIKVWKVLRKYQKKSERFRTNYRKIFKRPGQFLNGDSMTDKPITSGNVLAKYSQGWYWSAPNEKEEHELLFGIPQHPIAMRPEILHLKKAVLRSVLNSQGNIALFPLQDILGLGGEHRINFPGLDGGNWLWRVPQSLLTNRVADETAALTRKAKRNQS